MHDFSPSKVCKSQLNMHLSTYPPILLSSYLPIPLSPYPPKPALASSTFRINGLDIFRRYIGLTFKKLVF